VDPYTARLFVPHSLRSFYGTKTRSVPGPLNLALGIQTMIEPQQAMSLLIEACPSFKETWLEHFREHGNELLYMAAGDFAHHLLLLQQANDQSSFPAVALAIERLHLEGSPWVKEFATIGILEDVQNVWANNSIDPEIFKAFLLPESQRCWLGLNRFWSGEIPTSV